MSNVIDIVEIVNNEIYDKYSLSFYEVCESLIEEEIKVLKDMLGDVRFYEDIEGYIIRIEKLNCVKKIMGFE